MDVVVSMPDGSTTRVRKDAAVQTERDAERFEQELRRSILNDTFGKESATVVPTLAVFEKEFMSL